MKKIPKRNKYSEEIKKIYENFSLCFTLPSDKLNTFMILIYHIKTQDLAVKGVF